MLVSDPTPILYTWPVVPGFLSKVTAKVKHSWSELVPHDGHPGKFGL